MKQESKSETRWHQSMIPLYMAIGNPGLLITLIALSLGASVAEIGVISSAGAIASFTLSIVWGKISDLSGKRKIYLLFLAIILIPIFLALSIVNGVPQLIVLYTLLTAISCGVTPIAIMYTVESCRGKNWEGGVARFNSIMSVGNIIGLLTYTVAARFYETNILFYVSAFFCLAAALMLWRLGQEPEITLERNPFSFRLLHNVESRLSLRPILHSLDVRRIRVPRKLDQVKPLQLLLLTAFVHWLGISFWFVGITPLMRELGLSDSLILALNVANGVASATSFVWIAPRMKNNYKKLSSLVLSRAGVILCWAALPYFLVHTTPLVFVFPLLLSIIFNVLYAMIWLPLTNFAISQAPEEHKSSVVGQLMSATGVAGAVGSILGGLTITTHGYTVGFIIASAIVVLSIPIVSRMDAIYLD